MQFAPDLLSKCWFLAGPTATGKSAASLELAARLDAEIVALDSMTLYRGMNIGTAKPDAAARAQAPHHLLDILDPSQEFSLAEYLRAADKACREIAARDKTPLFVGGTGLYLRTVLRGLFEGPPADWAIRRRWHDFTAKHGEDALHARLGEVDLPLAEKLSSRDVRRIIRGLEVFELTGQPLSVLQREFALPPAHRPRHVYWLHPPRDWLRARIDRRVTQMLEQGFVAEVEELLRGTAMGRTARQALGYREMIEHLQGGPALPATIELIQSRTRQFAKRQHTWFRQLEECRAIEITGAENPDQIAQRVLDAAKQSRSTAP